MCIKIDFFKHAGIGLTFDLIFTSRVGHVLVMAWGRGSKKIKQSNIGEGLKNGDFPSDVFAWPLSHRWQLLLIGYTLEGAVIIFIECCCLIPNFRRATNNYS